MPNRYLIAEISNIRIVIQTGGEFDLMMVVSEAVFQENSYKKGFLKHAVNLQEKENAKLHSNFIEITLHHGCSINLMHIFKIIFYKNTSE